MAGWLVVGLVRVGWKNFRVAEEGKPARARKELSSLERGKDLSRILAFTDGVFAIAITLLVLQIEVPEGMGSNADFLEQLDGMIPDLFAFAISFIVIGMYWINHHRLMRMVGEYNRRLMLMTMFYLAWIVLVPFSSQLIGEYGSTIGLATVFYILNLAMIALGYSLMIRTIIADKLADPEYEWDLGLTLKSSQYNFLVFLLTAPLGLLIGAWTPLLWFPLMAFDPWQRRQQAEYKNRAG